MSTNKRVADIIGTAARSAHAAQTKNKMLMVTLPCRNEVRIGISIDGRNSAHIDLDAGQLEELIRIAQTHLDGIRAVTGVGP